MNVITQIHMHFRDLRVLDDISLTVQKGENAVIIGSAGPGKPAFSRIIDLLETMV